MEPPMNVKNANAAVREVSPRGSRCNLRSSAFICGSNSSRVRAHVGRGNPRRIDRVQLRLRNKPHHPLALRGGEARGRQRQSSGRYKNMTARDHDGPFNCGYSLPIRATGFTHLCLCSAIGRSRLRGQASKTRFQHRGSEIPGISEKGLFAFRARCLGRRQREAPKTLLP
jgi:hypothetical protein